MNVFASPVVAELIASVLVGGSYRKHMEELRLVRARRQTAARLQSLGIQPWLMPRGGFHLWCQLQTIRIPPIWHERP